MSVSGAAINGRKSKMEKKRYKCGCVYLVSLYGIETIKTPSGKELNIGHRYEKDRFVYCPFCGKKFE